MPRAHRHSEECAPDCRRKVDVDPSDARTGSWRVMARKGYGRRPSDKPWWWPLFVWTWHVWSLVAAAAVLKACGLKLPEIGP